MSGTDQKSKSRVAIDSSLIGGRSRSMTGIGQKSSKSLSLSRLKVRKQSYGFGGVPGVGGQTRRRSSQAGVEYKRPPLIYLNTYQLKPRVAFHVANVTKAIDSILDAYYTDSKYNKADSPLKTMLIADEVMRSVKDMNFDRYRIIAVVTLAQKRAQNYNNAVAFLWDHEFDSIVNIQRENTTSFIQVTCFGVYLD